MPAKKRSKPTSAKSASASKGAKPAVKKTPAKATTSKVDKSAFSAISLHVQESLPKPKLEKGKVWAPIKEEWLEAKPEELVRQSFVLYLEQRYGYKANGPAQHMAQERRTQHGHRSPKADIVIWQTNAQKAANKEPVIVVECKAEHVEINPKDYYQGESYARAAGAQFLVMHNTRHTAFFKVVKGAPGELVQISDIPAAKDWSDAKRIEEIKNSTRAFSRREFQDLLHRCHGILRDVHKMEPGRAFDAISKVLFIKMYIERTGTWGTFTTEFLDKRNETRLPTDLPIHEALFNETKKHYDADEIFAEGDTLDISEETFRRIVRELQGFNLSATGDDVKGLAFEQFLGDTFRGNLGQFFTPRPVVEFMVRLLNPREGELVCDPAAGSGGFLIHAFEHVRNAIEADVQARKDAERARIESLGLPEEKEEAEIDKAFALLNTELDPEQEEPESRIYKLAHHCIFGADAEPRAARTAKMNMIMHGDGHGGIHYHDGLVDIGGIFEGRFDVVLSNPPFGSNVGDDQKINSSEQTRVLDDPKHRKLMKAMFGDSWVSAHEKLRKAAREGASVLSLYEIGKDTANRATEVLFLERCLRLLQPGGRLGIVLPDGNLNNPSLGWLRRWAEGKARLLAVVSLPEETFQWADATVKASLVFMQKFTPFEASKWNKLWYDAHVAHDRDFNNERQQLHSELASTLLDLGDNELKSLLKELKALKVERILPEFERRPLPDYVRGPDRTVLVRAKWIGTPSNKSAAAKLRALFEARIGGPLEEDADEQLRLARIALRKLDARHAAAVLGYVRERFDYPVFTASPNVVGITSTGSTGPNDLPKVLAAYRTFESWLAAGAADPFPEFGAL